MRREMVRFWKKPKNSIGAIRMAAISEERFEGFLAGVLVEQAFPFFRVQLLREELVASLAYLREPFFVFRSELIFELFSEALCKGRALSSGGNGDLQRSTLHDGGIVEIAKRGDIHNVAEHATLRGLSENALVEIRGGRGCDNQKHSFKIVRLKRPLMPFDAVRMGPGAHLRSRLVRHHAHATAGLQEAGDFGFGDGSRSDDEAGPGRKLEEQGEELCRFHVFTQRAPR